MSEDWTEKQLDHALFSQDKGLARQLGWKLNYHVLRSKGSQAGFPDRVLVRDRVVFVETKTEKGKPTEAQEAWMTGLARAGAEVYLVRPSDLKEIAKALAGRFDWTPWSLRKPAGGRGITSSWQPGCLWLPSGQRADGVAE